MPRAIDNTSLAWQPKQAKKRSEKTWLLAGPLGLSQRIPPLIIMGGSLCIVPVCAAPHQLSQYLGKELQRSGVRGTSPTLAVPREGAPPCSLRCLFCCCLAFTQPWLATQGRFLSKQLVILLPGYYRPGLAMHDPAFLMDRT